MVHTLRVDKRVPFLFKKNRAGLPGAAIQIIPDGIDSLAADWDQTFFLALTRDFNDIADQIHLLGIEPHQFANADSRAVERFQDRAVPLTPLFYRLPVFQQIARLLLPSRI